MDSSALEPTLADPIESAALPHDRGEERPVPPRRSMSFGRRLAFTFDDEALEMAAATHVGRRSHLIACQKVYLPGGSASEEAHDAIIVDAIKQFTEEFGGRSASIDIVIGGGETVFRSFSMPALKPADLREAIIFEARKQVPFPLGDCFWDYRVVARYPDSEQPRVRVSLVAGLRQRLLHILSYFDRLGLRVNRVRHSLELLGGVLGELPFFDASSSYCLLQIERRRSEVSYYQGGELRFSHGLSLGSTFLANRMDTTVFEFFAETLAGEIQNSLDYYAGQVAGGPADVVHVYGDLAYSDDLIDLLTDRFGMEFRRFPTDQLSFAQALPEAAGEELPVCLASSAAALSTVSGINLLPPERQSANESRRINWYGTLSLAFATLCLATAGLLLRTEVAGTEQKLAHVQDRKAQVEASPAHATFSVVQDELQGLSSFISALTHQDDEIHEALKELSRVIPERVRLVTVDVRHEDGAPRLYLSGEARTSLLPPELAVAELIQKLDASAVFGKASLQQFSGKRIDDTYRYRFTCTVELVS